MSNKENKSNKKEVIGETNEHELVEAFSSLLDSVTPEKTKTIKSKKRDYTRKYKEPNVEEVIIQEEKGLNVFSSLLEIQENYPEDLPSDTEPHQEKVEKEKYTRKYVETQQDDPTDDVSGKDSLEGWIEKKPIEESKKSLNSLASLLNGEVNKTEDSKKVEIKENVVDKPKKVIKENSTMQSVIGALGGDFLENIRKSQREKDRKNKLQIERILEKQRNEVKEELDEFSQFRNEFEIFKKTMETKLTLREQVGFASNSLGSGAGSGEVRLLNLDDVDGTGIGNNSILKYNSTTGKFAVGTDTGGLSNIVEDTTPQLGGNLDVNGNSIVSTSDGNIAITPNGSGAVVLDGLSFPTSDGTNGQFLKTDGSGSLSFATVSSSVAFDDVTAGDSALNITTTTGNITIDAQANNSDIILKGTDGTSDTTFLTIDGSAAGKATFNNEIVSGAVITSGAGLVIADDGTIGSASDTDAIAISASGVVTFSQNPVFPDGGVAIVDLDIDGGTDIGEALADADLFVVDNGAGGTNRKTEASRIKTYIADVTLTTAAQTNITSLGTLTTLTVDDITINGSTISDSGDLTLDIGGDIVLDAGGEQVIFKDGSTNVGHVDLSSDNLTLKSLVSDKDFIVKGNDGGTEITALTLDMSAAGAATFNNNVTAFSDERLKSEIKTIEDGLTKVEQLRGVTYVRDDIKDSGQQLGVIAQEIEKVLPQVVLTANDDMQTKSVDYGRLTGVLIEAVKELSARVKELESK